MDNSLYGDSKMNVFNTFIAGIMVMTSALSCNKEEDCSSSVPINEPIVSAGSSYIGCEAGAFFISLGDVDSCSTVFGFDSLFAESWEPGCNMSDLMGDSSLADIQVTYLADGVLDIQGQSLSLDISPFDLVIGGESVDLTSYPYYGALRFEYEARTYSFVMLNRYIGGCFHDELIWEITE